MCNVQGILPIYLWSFWLDPVIAYSFTSFVVLMLSKYLSLVVYVKIFWLQGKPVLCSFFWCDYVWYITDSVFSNWGRCEFILLIESISVDLIAWELLHQKLGFRISDLPKETGCGNNAYIGGNSQDLERRRLEGYFHITGNSFSTTVAMFLCQMSGLRAALISLTCAMMEVTSYFLLAYWH